MRRAVERVGGSTWLSGVVVFIGLFLLGAAWSIATPLAASPDEPAHIVKAAAVVRGDLVGKPTGQSGYTRVTVPSAEGEAWQWTCIAFHPKSTANCQGTPAGNADNVEALTSAGFYNPVYYALVGWPTLIFSEPHAAVYSMRLLTSLLCSALLAVAITALFSLRRSIVTGLAALTVATPTMLFLSGSVNPNAVEVAAGAALIALLLVLVRGPIPARRGLVLTLVAISGLLLANTRALSPLWMALIAVIALVAAERGRIRELFRSPLAWVTLAVLAAGTAFGVIWTARTGTLGNMGHFPGAGTNPVSAFFVMILDRSFDPGLLGLFGWLDTPAPTSVLAVWTFLALTSVIGALILVRGRLLAAVLVSIAGFFLIPAVVQSLSVRQSGYIWQGRYSLVAYACVMIVCAFAIAASDSGVVRFPRRFVVRATITVGSIVACAQAFAVAGALRRYAVGIEGSWAYFLRAPLWQAPGSNILWIAVAFLGAAAVAWVWVARSATEAISSRSRDTSESTDSPGYPAAMR